RADRHRAGLSAVCLRPARGRQLRIELFFGSSEARGKLYCKRQRQGLFLRVQSRSDRPLRSPTQAAFGLRKYVKLSIEPIRPVAFFPSGAVPEPIGSGELARNAFEQASNWRSFALALVSASRDSVKLIDLDGRVAAVSPAVQNLLQLDDT